MNWQSITIGTAFALFVVWMERQGRWSLFLGATAGDYILGGTRQGGTQTTSTSGDVTPAQANPNSTRSGTGAPAQATIPGGGGSTPPAATSTGAGIG